MMPGYPIIQILRKCRKCGKEKPLTEFERNPNNHHCFSYLCKSCKALQNEDSLNRSRTHQFNTLVGISLIRTGNGSPMRKAISDMSEEGIMSSIIFEEKEILEYLTYYQEISPLFRTILNSRQVLIY